MKYEHQTKAHLIDELKKLQRRIARLEKLSATQKRVEYTLKHRMQAEEALQKRTYDLNERVKELSCLYALSKLVEKSDVGLEEIFQKTIELIPPAYQYPEITCAQIVHEGQTYTTPNFSESPWKQSSSIHAQGKRVGILEIFYLEEKPVADEGPFLKEERYLINAIAEQVGHIIERLHTEEELRSARDQLELKVQQRTRELNKLNEQSRQEIEERKNIEKKFKLNQSRLEALLKLSTMGAASLNEIAVFVLEEGVKLTQSKIGFLGFMEKDEQSMTLYAWSKSVMKECAIIDKPIHYPLERAGLWGEAVRQKMPLLVNDYSSPHPSKKGYPEGHVPLSQLLILPALAKDKVVSVLAVGNKGEDYDESDLNQLRLLTDSMWKILEQAEAEQSLRERNAELLVLNTLIHKVSTSLMLDQVVQSALDEIVALIVPDIALFFMREGKQLILHGSYPASSTSPYRETPVHRVGECLCGLAVSSGEPLFSGDIHRDQRCTWEECKKAGIQSFTALPLSIGDEVIGVLGLGSYTPREFEQRADFLKVLAGEITIGLQNAILYRQIQLHTATLEQEIAERKHAQEALLKSEEQLESLSSQLFTFQEKERQRVAQELHDTVGQTLTALKYRIENILNQMSRGEMKDYHPQLEVLIPKIQDAIEEVDKIGKGLRPSILDDLGIIATLSWFCREFETVYSDIHIEKEISLQEEEVPEALKVVMYRILQEVLNNIAKHSGANHVTISLKKINHTLEMAIQDNGSGFDVEQALAQEREKGGLGLISMIKRAELSGGTLVITFQKKGGTLIKAQWPCVTQLPAH